MHGEVCWQWRQSASDVTLFTLSESVAVNLQKTMIFLFILLVIHTEDSIMECVFATKVARKLKVQFFFPVNLWNVIPEGNLMEMSINPKYHTTPLQPFRGPGTAHKLRLIKRDNIMPTGKGLRPHRGIFGQG